MKKQPLKDTLGFGLMLWFIGYVLGFILFFIVPASMIGWVITPIGISITLWVLLKKVHTASFIHYILIAVTWTLIAIVFDYIFIVKALHPADGYYKLDVYLYYASTFILPLIAGIKHKKIKNTIKGYVSNIEKLSLENNTFRSVLYTAKNCQLVLMSLTPQEEISEEVHDVDQFLRIEKGTGTAILNDISHAIADGSVIIVPAGTKHNVINTGSDAMKLYTLYMPPHHRDGVIHKTKTEAEADTTDEFDGKTTE